MHNHQWEDQGAGSAQPRSWKCNVCGKVVFSENCPPEQDIEPHPETFFTRGQCVEILGEIDLSQPATIRDHLRTALMTCIGLYDKLGQMAELALVNDPRNSEPD